MSEEKELSTDVNMTIYTGGEEWEKAKEAVSQAFEAQIWDECLNLPLTDTEKLNLLPYPLFFKLCVSDIVSKTFYHEYEDFLKGKKTFPADFDYSLEGLIKGFKDLRQIKSLALAFRAYIKWDKEFAMIWFKDFSLLGFSNIN